MIKCEFRPATLDDALAFYGRRPQNTFRGIVAVEDGKVIGIGGIANDNGIKIAFSDMGPEMRKHRKATAKACRMLIDMVKEVKSPVYAVADENEPTSTALLAKLGFEPTGIYGENGEVLIWKEK